jgi:hypothetical protein
MDGNTPLVGLNIYRFGACSYRGGRLLILFSPSSYTHSVGRWRRCLEELFSFVFTFTTHLLSLFSPYFNKLIMDGFMKSYD